MQMRSCTTRAKASWACPSQTTPMCAASWTSTIPSYNSGQPRPHGGCVGAHANYKSWMNDSWEKLEGEQVESSVTGALK
eukprot:scaffold120132_cov16-Tisochrysis_lutea.AAC.1